MSLSPLRAFGIILASVFCILIIASILTRQCACTVDQECFCIDDESTLSPMTEEDLAKITEPGQSEYRAFLAAWEAEYTERKHEWANLYTAFYATEHDSMTERSFDTQLAQSHQNFIEVFRQRDALFRERIGL